MTPWTSVTEGIPSLEALDRRQRCAGAPELIGQEYRGSGLDLAISGVPTGDWRRLRMEIDSLTAAIERRTRLRGCHALGPPLDASDTLRDAAIRPRGGDGSTEGNQTS